MTQIARRGSPTASSRVYLQAICSLWASASCQADMAPASPGVAVVVVVAPGIAEALLATALGLVAAIPAVMIYNVLARSTAQYRALLGDASAQVMSSSAAISTARSCRCRKPPSSARSCAAGGAARASCAR